MGRVFLGIDPSLRACGACVVPSDWSGAAWYRLRFHTFPACGSTPGERLHEVAMSVLRVAKAHEVTDVWIEGAAYGAPGFHRVAEVAGAIKAYLHGSLGLSATEAPISSARKLVLGAVTGKDQKGQVHRSLHACGARFDTLDECDAFVVANYGLHEAGLPCIYVPPPPKAEKLKRSRRAA